MATPFRSRTAMRGVNNVAPQEDKRHDHQAVPRAPRWPPSADRDRTRTSVPLIVALQQARRREPSEPPPFSQPCPAPMREDTSNTASPGGSPLIAIAPRLLLPP